MFGNPSFDKGKKLAKIWVISKILFMNFNEDITFQYKEILLQKIPIDVFSPEEVVINVNL